MDEAAVNIHVWVRRMKRETIVKEKLIAEHLKKDLYPKYIEDLQNSLTEKQKGQKTNPIKKWKKDLNRQFPN